MPTDTAALRERVLADLNDVAAQVVYADWLEDQGDARASFWRLVAARRLWPERPTPAPAWYWLADGLSMSVLRPCAVTTALMRAMGQSYTVAREIQVKRVYGKDGLLRALLCLEQAWAEVEG